MVTDTTKREESSAKEEEEPAPTRKRPRSKRNDDTTYRQHYQNFSYIPIPSTGRPGTPHRYFAESYAVRPKTETTDNQAPESPADETLTHMPIIHKHANGLLIVTAGRNYEWDKIDVHRIKLHPTPAPASSTGSKRKQQSAMLRGKKSADAAPGVVRPDDTLCTLETTQQPHHAAIVHKMPCAVWGTLLEVNPRLSVDLLKNDPLLSGYLAVVLPTGRFPPPDSA